MGISQVIAANLSKWMASSPGLDTLEKLEARAGVGFGTVRRARKGEGNITVEKLEKIAAAFGRNAADLLIDGTASAGDDGRIRRSDNTDHQEVVAESRATYRGRRWPFEQVSEQRYDALTEVGKAWVQAKTESAIEEAERRYGTQPGKRTA